MESSLHGHLTYIPSRRLRSCELPHVAPANFRVLGRKADQLFRDLVSIRLAIPFIVAIASITPASVAQNPSTGSSSADHVILKVGDKQITQAQFEQMIADLEAQQGPADMSRKQLGEKFASLFILSQQAVADHLDSSPEVVRLMAIDRTQILSNAEFAKLKAEAKPTPDQISAYYNAHLDDYDVVELRRVFIWKKAPDHDTGVNPQDAHALADAIRQAYASGTDPKKVVKDPQSVTFDNAPLKFQRGEMPAAMEKPAFAMQKVGEWTELADTSGGLVLMQLVSRGRRSLSDMSPQIEKKLQNEEMREKLQALKKRTDVWMDETYFASKVPVSASSTEPEAPGQGKSTERGEK